LMVNEWVDYLTLKELLDATDGNLASHLASLEKGELIKVEKQFVGRKPNTRYSATKKGREQFTQHLEFLSKLLKENK
jgi:predicted ArsR family transcriptional regulator